MKLKVFEVVELLDGNKATILENNKNRYKKYGCILRDIFMSGF